MDFWTKTYTKQDSNLILIALYFYSDMKIMILDNSRKND